MIFGIDFDGTCVTHEYPCIGKPTGATSVLKKIMDNDHKIILYTMRDGRELEEAVQWFTDNGILLWGVNYNPEQYTWTSSPKIHCDCYIDDCSLGIPLITDFFYNRRPYVDWFEVNILLERRGVFK